VLAKEGGIIERESTGVAEKVDLERGRGERKRNGQCPKK
jgi:hypothetical protein